MNKLFIFVSFATLVVNYVVVGREINMFVAMNSMPANTTTHPILKNCTEKENELLSDEFTNATAALVMEHLPYYDIAMVPFDMYNVCPTFPCNYNELCYVWCSNITIDTGDDANQISSHGYELMNLSHHSFDYMRVNVIDNIRKYIQDGNITCLGDDRRYMMRTFISVEKEKPKSVSVN